MGALGNEPDWGREGGIHLEMAQPSKLRAPVWVHCAAREAYLCVARYESMDTRTHVHKWIC